MSGASFNRQTVKTVATYGSDTAAEHSHRSAIIALVLFALAAIVIRGVYLMNLTPVVTHFNTRVTAQTIARIESVVEGVGSPSPRPLITSAIHKRLTMRN